MTSVLKSNALANSCCAKRCMDNFISNNLIISKSLYVNSGKHYQIILLLSNFQLVDKNCDESSHCK